MLALLERTQKMRETGMNGFKFGAAFWMLSAIGSASAAPSVPTIDVYGSNNLQFSKIELTMDSTSGYYDMVKYSDEAEVSIKFTQWSGDPGDSYKVYFDDVEVASGAISGNQTTAIFSMAQGGRYNVAVEACDPTGCSRSAEQQLIIADTDGSHLEPLNMNVDPNNKSYVTDPDTVVGTYFVEWGIYEREYTVDNIPVDNLTHILYGFIPICGPNESLKSVGGNSYNALVTACRGVQDYEVVIHDPWAAYQKSFPQAGHKFSSPIKGNYAMLMALKQRNPDLKVIPSIGGWTLSDPFYDFTNKAYRDRFVASVKRFLQTWKFFDGVDIDWEFPGGGGAGPDLGDPINDGPAYIALMQELRAMLDELGAETGRTYELTSAIGVGYDKIEDVDYSNAVQYMDYIFAMTYDFYGGWNNVPGHQTALFCGRFMRAGQCDGSGSDDKGVPYKGPAYTADNGIKLLLAQGVPANKLVLGAAMYGRGWEGVLPDTLTDPLDPMTGKGTGKLKGSKEQGVWEEGVIDYKGIKRFMLGTDNLGVNGFQYGYDDQAQAPWVWNQETGQLITFDDPRSVMEKGAYVRSLGLAGLFSWEIDADNGDILNAIHEGLAADKPRNQPPVARTSSDMAVVGPISLNLDGSNSEDADGQIVRFEWEQISGPRVSLSGENNTIARIDIPEVLQKEVIAFNLTVTDNGGAKDTDTVLVTVSPKGTSPNNRPPIIKVLAPQTVKRGESVVVDASATSDPDSDPLSYQWTAPPDIIPVITSNKLTFNVGDYKDDRVLEFSLEVSDGTHVVKQPIVIKVIRGSGGGDLCSNLWSEEKVYNGGDKVSWDNKVWQAKWWTQGDNPSMSGEWGVWKLIGNADCPTS